MTYVAKCPKCGGTICKSKTEIRNAEKLFCDHCKESVFCQVAYFPDDTKNKVFVVDTYLTIVKSFKVEAKDDEEAKRVVEDMLTSFALTRPDGEDVRELAGLGFCYADEMEMNVSGSADKDGDIHYH